MHYRYKVIYLSFLLMSSPVSILIFNVISSEPPRSTSPDIIFIGESPPTPRVPPSPTITPPTPTQKLQYRFTSTNHTAAVPRQLVKTLHMPDGQVHGVFLCLSICLSIVTCLSIHCCSFHYCIHLTSKNCYMSTHCSFLYLSSSCHRSIHCFLSIICPPFFFSSV